MARLSTDAIERVESIDWFSAVGAAVEVDGARELSVHRISSIAEANDQLSSGARESATADAAARLTAWLHEHCPSDYQVWNELARAAKEVIGRTALPAARAFATSHSFDGVIVDCVAWDLLNAVMEASYAQCRPPVFFVDMLTVYEAGHLPCGWDGTWPDGTLL
jgi:hypothetical protein